MKGNTFYSNENTSSSSITYDQSTLASQVSSVGFNNLKKINSNSSLISSASTSTIKTNPLTRLFTRNKSSTNFPLQQQSQNSDHPNNSDDDLIIDQPKSFNTNIIKLQKKNKLKLTNKSNLNKPELSIQTSGHHNLRVPKKILSSSSIDELQAPRKNSVSSPVSTFYNFFHRNHSFSQQGQESQNYQNSKDDLANSQKLNSNPLRVNITLSSNSSNSQITDPKLAMIYNFTNPDFGFDDSEYLNDHNIFFDLQKKLMVPTDQYFQKLNKNQNKFNNPREEENEYLIKYMVEFHKDNAKFFQTLQEVTKNLFRPSQQVPISESLHPYLGVTLEDLSNFVRDTYIRTVSSETNEPKHTSEKSGMNKTPKSRAKYNKQSNTNLKELSTHTRDQQNDFSDIKIREISQDLLSYFTRCMIILQNDSKNYDFQEYKDTFTIDLDGITPKTIGLLEGWIKITLIWQYFNTKVRFFTLGFLQPLQNYYNEKSLLNLVSSDKVYNINIESLLLLAFRDVIIIPFLMDRISQYSEHYKPDSSMSVHTSALASPIKSSKNTLEHEEKHALEKNRQLRSYIINCLGTIATQTNIEFGYSDGQQGTRNEIFLNAFSWVTTSE